MNADPPDLIPVRALNQVSYCPRLYYLEYVESVMPINEYVEDGLFQHRRVNDPDLANRTRKEGTSLRTRSVSLSSERLGITGKLDLLEERGEATRPVEYKRSAAPRDEDGEPRLLGERRHPALRPGAAGRGEPGRLGPGRHPLLHRLEGARGGPASTNRCGPRRWRRSRLIRDLSARDSPPEPLPAELRHRCFGCSLAPICLPEETLYLIHQPEPAPDDAPGRRAGRHRHRPRPP